MLTTLLPLLDLFYRVDQHQDVQNHVVSDPSVQRAVEEAGIRYPVVLDNNSATWDAYDNRYWPAWYLIDADGFIRYQHFGEGAYEENEEEIQELLSERDEISS